MQILLKGYYGFGNLGDDILMKVMYSWLDSLGTFNIDVYSGFSTSNNAFPDNYPATYNGYIHAILNANPLIVDWTHKNNYKIIINGGGGVHFDHSKGGSIYGLFNNLIKIIGCKKTAKLESVIRKVFEKQHNITAKLNYGIGLGIGDFNSDGREFFRHVSAIGQYDFLWVRDGLSESWLRKLGYKGKLIRSTDLAFNDFFWKPEVNILKKEDSVGIVGLVKETLNGKYYLEQLELIRKLKSEGFSVKYYLFQELTDYKLKEKFENEVDVVVWKPHKQTLESFLLNFGSNKMVVSGRAHGTILASCLNSPSVTLSTSSKLNEVAKMLPNSCKLMPKNASSSDVLKVVLDGFINYDQLCENLYKEVEYNRNNVISALNQTEYLIKSNL